LPDGAVLHSRGHIHIEHVTFPHVSTDAIVVPNAHLLFNGDFKRSGVDLILSRDDQELVLHDYFRGEKRAALSSPDGAHLTGDVVNALTGYVQYSQAGSSAAAGKVIGHVTKLVGTATAIRNGVSIVLTQGENVEKGDVVQSGSDSRLGITFIDGTVFGLAQNARMVLNEMVYDPNGSDDSSLFSLVAGTISFVAGESAKHGDMKVDTPVATMGIRGTACLVEIQFQVPQGVSPPIGPVLPASANFQVVIEPDGTTGSYILYDKTTLAPIATVNQAGTQTSITSQGVVNFNAMAPLSLDAQKIINDVFTLKFTDLFNPRTNTALGSAPIGQSGPLVELASGEFVTPMILLATNKTAPGTSVNQQDTSIFLPISIKAVDVFSVSDRPSFAIADQVQITDSNPSDPITLYVPGTARILSVVGPSNIPTGVVLAQLVTVDPATGVVHYDPANFAFLGVNQKVVVTIGFDSLVGSDTFHETLNVTIDSTAKASVTTPTITGDAVEGHVLTASASSNDPAATVTYQWFSSADGYTHAIGSGANYTVKEADENHTLKAVATATDTAAGIAPVSATSAATATVTDATATLATPTISGDAIEGQILTASATATDSDATVTYQWFSSADGYTHAIASGATYTVQEADESHTLKVVATAADVTGGTPPVSATSAATATVTDAAASVTTPTISGDAIEGQTLTASATANDSDATVTYQWFSSADGYTTAIGFGAHYILQEADERHTLKVVATAADVTGGTPPVSATSAATATVTDAEDRDPAGVAGSAINLGLTQLAGVGSEAFTVTGAPPNWTMDGATHNADGSWTAQTNDFSTLTITPAAGFVGAAVLNVIETWTNSDGSAGSMTVSDNVEAYARGSPIFAVAGDDHLTGTGTGNLFVFAQPFGNDIIYDFNAASDKIDLIGFDNIARFADIQGHIADDANGNAVIKTGANETITVNGVHAASLTASDFVFNQEPITENPVTMRIGDGAHLAVSGTIDNTGAIELSSTGDETALQLIEHGVTLTGAGHVDLSDSAENAIGGTSADVTLTNVDNTISGAGQIGAGQLTLINKGTIDATDANSLTVDTGVNAVTNSGTLEATGSGGLIVRSDVFNTGFLWANGGNVTLQGEVSGNGIAKIDGAGVLDFEAASTGNVVFGSAAAGMLKLGDSFHFNGTISGFAGSDTVDLANFGPAIASISYHENTAGTGGTLAISDGAQTVELSLLGHYSADNFSIVPDHAKGTLVTYVPHDLAV
jgi:hypothetical protein